MICPHSNINILLPCHSQRNLQLRYLTPQRNLTYVNVMYSVCGNFALFTKVLMCKVIQFLRNVEEKVTAYKINIRRAKHYDRS